jgi:hypothetical protein
MRYGITPSAYWPLNYWPLISPYVPPPPPTVEGLPPPNGQIQFYFREQVRADFSITGIPTATASDIRFSTEDNSLNSSSTNFQSLGYEAAMQIAISGSARNNVIGVIKEVYRHKIILIDCALVPEDAGASVTIAPNYILRANVGNSDDAAIGERCYICDVCRGVFPKHLVREFRGKYYCVPNEDYKDIASILKREYAAGYRPKNLGTDDRVIPPIIKG